MSRAQVQALIQTSLDDKAPLASPTFTGTLTAADISADGITSATGVTVVPQAGSGQTLQLDEALGGGGQKFTLSVAADLTSDLATTISDATGPLITANGTETLTNKTMDFAANTFLNFPVSANGGTTLTEIETCPYTIPGVNPDIIYLWDTASDCDITMPAVSVVGLVNIINDTSANNVNLIPADSTEYFRTASLALSAGSLTATYSNLTDGHKLQMGPKSMTTLKADPTWGEWAPLGVPVGVYTDGGSGFPVVDTCTGALTFAWHMESIDVTLGSPTGCSVGDTTATLNATAAISATQKQDGTYSLSTPVSGDAGYFSISARNLATEVSGTAILYVYVTTHSSRTEVLRIHRDTQNTIIASINTSGNLVLSYEGTDVPVTVTTSNAIGLNAWHKLTVKWRQTGSPTTLSAQIDSGTEATTTSALTSWALEPSYLYVGNRYGVAGGVAFVDNLKVYNTWQ
jgi:hypothetical protein